MSVGDVVSRCGLLFSLLIVSNIGFAQDYSFGAGFGSDFGAFNSFGGSVFDPSSSFTGGSFLGYDSGLSNAYGSFNLYDPAAAIEPFNIYGNYGLTPDAPYDTGISWSSLNGDWGGYSNPGLGVPDIDLPVVGPMPLIDLSTTSASLTSQAVGTSISNWNTLDVMVAGGIQTSTVVIVETDNNDFRVKPDFDPLAGLPPVKVSVDLDKVKSFLEFSAEGRGMVLEAGMVMLGMAIEQKTLSNQQILDTVKNRVLPEMERYLLTPFNSADDKAYTAANDMRFWRAKEELAKFVNNGGQGPVPLSLVGISASREEGILVEENGKSYSLNFNLKAGTATVKYSDGSSSTQPLPGFVRSPAGQKLADLGEQLSDLGSSQGAYFGSNYNSVVFTAQAFDQWETTVGIETVTSVFSINPVATQQIMDGTSLWNQAYGGEKVSQAIANDSSGVAKIFQGTVQAIEIFGQDVVEEAIRGNPEKAVSAAKMVQSAKEFGYSDDEIRQHIQQNPDTWLQWQPGALE